MFRSGKPLLRAVRCPVAALNTSVNVFLMQGENMSTVVIKSQQKCNSLTSQDVHGCFFVFELKMN